MPDAVIEDLLEDGTLSDIEGLDEFDGEFEPQKFDRLTNEVLEPLDVDMDVPPSPIPPPTPPPARGRSSGGRAARGRSARGNAASGITGRGRSVSGVSAQDRSTPGRLAPRTTRDTQRSASTPSTLRARISASSSINSDQESSRRRLWKQDSFEDKPHEYMPLPTNAVRRPIDYFRDYFDKNFIGRLPDAQIYTICAEMVKSLKLQVRKSQGYLEFIYNRQTSDNSRPRPVCDPSFVEKDSTW